MSDNTTTTPATMDTDPQPPSPPPPRRRRRMRTIILAGGATLGAATAITGIDALLNKAERHAVSLPGPIDRVELDVSGGSVTIVSTTGPTITIEIVRHGGLRGPQHTESLDGTTLDIRSSCRRLLTFTCGIDYIIHVPAPVDIVARGSGTSYNMTDTAGDVDLSLNGGDADINLTSIPDAIRGRSTGGDIRVVVPPRTAIPRPRHLVRRRHPNRRGHRSPKRERDRPPQHRRRRLHRLSHQRDEPLTHHTAKTSSTSRRHSQAVSRCEAPRLTGGGWPASYAAPSSGGRPSSLGTSVLADCSPPSLPPARRLPRKRPYTRHPCDSTVRSRLPRSWCLVTGVRTQCLGSW